MSNRQNGFSLIVCVVVSGLLAWSLIDCLQALQKAQEIFAMTASKHHFQQLLLSEVRQGKLKPSATQCYQLATCHGDPKQTCFLIWEDYQAHSADGLKLRQGFEWGLSAKKGLNCASLDQNKPFASKRLVYQKWL
jgi:hypothetical protein